MASPRTVKPEIIAWLRAQVETASVRRTATALRMSDGTLMRIIATLEVQAGTAQLLEAAYLRRGV